MRGADTFTESLFTMRHLDDFVPADHPLRVIRVMVNKALANMDGLFAQMYAADIKGGRPSIAPEKHPFQGVVPAPAAVTFAPQRENCGCGKKSWRGLRAMRR